MSRKIALVIVAAIAFAVPSISFGQRSKEPPQRVMADTPAFANLDTGQAMARAENKLKKVEAGLKRVKAKKMISAAETDAFQQDLMDYGQALMAASEKAHAEAKMAVDSKGAKGNTKAVVEFERLAKGHEARMSKVKADGDEIRESMRQGIIKPGKDFLDRIQGAEREKFKEFLTPQGRQELEKSAPGYFAAAPGANSISWRKVGPACRSAGRELGALVANLPGLLDVDDAGADAWAPCVGPCGAGDPLTCGACSLVAAWDTYNAWQDYQSCMGSVSWWNAWWLPVVCTVQFAVRAA